MAWAPRLVTVGLTAAILLTACSGEGGPTDDGTGRRTFIDRADAICYEAADQLGALGSRAEVTRPSEDSIVKFRIAVPIYRLLGAGLQQLDPPAGAGSEVAALIDKFERVADQGEEVIATGRTGDRDAFEAAVGEYWERLDAAIDANHELGLTCP